jgi:hypothetical protein
MYAALWVTFRKPVHHIPSATPQVTVRLTTATEQLQWTKKIRGVKHLTKSTDTFCGPKPASKITSMFAGRK